MKRRWVEVDSPTLALLDNLGLIRRYAADPAGEYPAAETALAHPTYREPLPGFMDPRIWTLRGAMSGINDCDGQRCSGAGRVVEGDVAAADRGALSEHCQQSLVKAVAAAVDLSIETDLEMNAGEPSAADAVDDRQEDRLSTLGPDGLDRPLYRASIRIAGEDGAVSIDIEPAHEQTSSPVGGAPAAAGAGVGAPEPTGEEPTSQGAAQAPADSKQVAS